MDRRVAWLGTFIQLIGKYQVAGRHPCNKVVLVARNGFTETARVRAAQASIDLFTLDEAKQSDWTKLVSQQMVWRMPPHIDQRLRLTLDLIDTDSRNSSRVFIRP